MPKLVVFVYYRIKPFLPRRIQIFLRRQFALFKRKKHADTWPILRRSNGRPNSFFGWPDQKRFALILTHDVETALGHEKSLDLMNLECRLGFRSSFYFVPERYNVSSELRKTLSSNGFEVGVHGLNHDGKLFSSKKIFEKRSLKINNYISQWQASGFRSPSMHHNFDWIHSLKIVYDASSFDTDPFEPQADGCNRIYPFWIQNSSKNHGYIELPYTLPQDFTVLILLRDFELSIWRSKLDWIAQRGGMALLNTHPDYMSFDRKVRFDEYQAILYERLLFYIKESYSGQYWHVLPKEIAKYWKAAHIE